MLMTIVAYLPPVTQFLINSSKTCEPAKGFDLELEGDFETFLGVEIRKKLPDGHYYCSFTVRRSHQESP